MSKKVKLIKILFQETYVEMTDLSKSNPIWNREERLGDFIDWLHSNNVNTSNFEICSFDNYGFGLKATKNLAVIY